MNKKMIIGVLVMLLICSGCGTKSNKKAEKVYKKIWDYEEYKKIKKDNIEYVNYSLETADGKENEMIEVEGRINNIYDYLDRIRVGKKTNKTCDNNYQLYEIKLKDDDTLKIEIKCDSVVIGGERYLIK